MSAAGKPAAAEEVEASRLFELLTNSRCRELDGMAHGSGLADFTVVDADGTDIGTLEVTRATDQTSLATAGAMRNVKRWDLSGTTDIWHVTVVPGADAKTLRDKVQTIVDRLVADDIESVQRQQPLGKELGLGSDRIVGVLRGPAASGGVGIASVMVSGPGGSTGRDILAEVAEAEFSKNANKMVAGGGRTAHLWVWLTWEQPDGADVMAASVRRGDPGPLPRTPHLALNCTIWLAVPGQTWALRWRHSDGWTIIA
jgi:hypothetical protein